MLRPLWRAVLLTAALVVIATVIWIDVTTPLWQDLVIISGLVAGAVTFLLTTLFIDRIVQRAARRRWAPVTRLALTEMLQQLTEAGAGGGRGAAFQPRQLPLPPQLDPATDAPAVLRATDDLRRAVVAERSRLSTSLVTWWNLLSSLPDTEAIIRHTADAALLLDSVRDASLGLDEAVEDGADTVGWMTAEQTLRARVMACNHSIAGIVAEITTRLEADEVGLSEKAEQTLALMHRRIARS